MTTHRRYFFEYPGQWPGAETDWETARRTLDHYCKVHWWFSDPTVEGQPFARLAFSVTVSARDQWWCHRRALGLATDVFSRIGVAEAHVPVPTWESLAPHTNRGRYRVPR
jgi:hypothetical protein